MAKETRIYMVKKKQSLQSVVPEKLHSYMILEHFVTKHTKIKSKWLMLKYKTRNHKTPRGKYRQDIL